MINLIDGRDSLWQYDTGRRVAVDKNCTTVHFSNVQFGGAYVVDVVDGEAAIPDEVLKNAGTLYCWAFSGTAEEGYTKTEQLFNVQRRAKPSDYTFTPTEQHSIGQVLGMIGSLEDLETDDKSDIVSAINEVNEIANEKQTVNHEDLKGRDEPNQHPIEAISGLELALKEKIGTDELHIDAIGGIIIQGNPSFPLGWYGDPTVILGGTNSALGSVIAIGAENSVRGNAVVIGNQNMAGSFEDPTDVDGCFEFGIGLKSITDGQTLFGRYNEIDVYDKYAFIFADGKPDAGKNVFAIQKESGNAFFSGKVFANWGENSADRLVAESELGSCAFVEKDDIVDEIMSNFVNAAEVAM